MLDFSNIDFEVDETESGGFNFEGTGSSVSDGFDFEGTGAESGWAGWGSFVQIPHRVPTVVTPRRCARSAFLSDPPRTRLSSLAVTLPHETVKESIRTFGRSQSPILPEAD